MATFGRCGPSSGDRTRLIGPAKLATLFAECRFFCYPSVYLDQTDRKYCHFGRPSHQKLLSCHKTLHHEKTHCLTARFDAPRVLVGAASEPRNRCHGHTIAGCTVVHFSRPDQCGRKRLSAHRCRESGLFPHLRPRCKPHGGRSVWQEVPHAKGWSRGCANWASRSITTAPKARTTSGLPGDAVSASLWGIYLSRISACRV